MLLADLCDRTGGKDILGEGWEQEADVIYEKRLFLRPERMLLMAEFEECLFVNVSSHHGDGVTVHT